MDNVTNKFLKLGVDNAPGQEVMQKVEMLNMIGDNLDGKLVDFSHGDVDAFKPIPGTLDRFIKGVEEGGSQAYTVYRGRDIIREKLSKKLNEFTKDNITPDKELIITPGTQGALFLAMGALISKDDKVAIMVPDYFANRKIAEFFEGDLINIDLKYNDNFGKAGIDLDMLEEAFKNGVKVFLFSNPNNPTGVVFSRDEVESIGLLANKYNVTVIADELYSRQIFDNREYYHLCSAKNRPNNMVTIIGPSKTESLSGYRLGVAFGSEWIIARMEKLQAIVSLRASGYNQGVLDMWFDEPNGWMDERIAQHESIRDDILNTLEGIEGVHARKTEAGSYLFITIPNLTVDLHEFIKILRLQGNVIVTPGTEFGKEFTNEFRINFSQDHEEAIKAIKRICILLERYRK